MMLRPAVAAAVALGATVAQMLAAPRMLSCEHDEEWASLAATMEGTRQASRLGLPNACSRLDMDLFNWSDNMYALLWPEGDAWEAFKHVQYNCDPEAPEGQRGECDSQGGRFLCLSGFIAASACIATMYAGNAAAMPGSGGTALGSVRGLAWMMHSPFKIFDFFDSATWVFTVADIAAILEVYAQALRDYPVGLEPGPLGPILSESSRPWDRDGGTWLRAGRAARESLAMVAAWQWPPPGMAADAPCGAARAAGGGRRLVRLWAFGTHCSVMSEPVASMALLLADEFDFRVVWRGGKDYCGFLHSPGWPAVVADPGSAVKEVYDQFHDIWKGDFTDKISHRDTLRTPALFEDAFREALKLEGADFIGADVGLCSEPAIVCALLHEGGKPVVGYFGVHIAFMVRGEQEQLRLYRRFRDELAADARSTFATVAPYLSLQMFHHVPVQVPAVRPLSMYTLPATYTATSPAEVLVSKRPIAFWDLMLVLNGFARLHDTGLSFADASVLSSEGRHKFTDWCAFRAAVYFPYDWLQTMAFYDWVNMGLPTFVADSPTYTMSWGTNAPGEWEAKLWHMPSAIYPHHYSDWGDFAGRAYWWLMTDFKALPGVAGFQSVADLLFELSSQDNLWNISGQLRKAQQQRVASGAIFWRGALLRALGRQPPQGQPGS